MKTNRPVNEMEHEFTLVLSGITPDTPGVEDALFAAGCDDATLAFRMGRPALTFSRVAPTLREAILSAIDDLRKAELEIDVVRVDFCNLVSQADIARKIGRSRQLVQLYMTGARGPGGFPGPACELSDGGWLWEWCEVASWLWSHDMLKTDELQNANDVEAINCILELRQHAKANPRLKEIVAKVGDPCSV